MGTDYEYLQKQAMRIFARLLRRGRDRKAVRFEKKGFLRQPTAIQRMLIRLAVLGALVVAGGNDSGSRFTESAKRLPESFLQAQLDAAPAGAVVEVGPGRYIGDLVIGRPVRLIGHSRPEIVGSGRGTVVRVTASDVVIDGFDIDGVGGGSLSDDTSGIHVTGARVTIRDCHVRNSLFGIYLNGATGATIEGSTVTGFRDRAPGEQGSGVHVFNTQGFRLVGNDVRYSRDGFFIQASHHGFISGNTARELRYGLHYMSSDDNVFEDNRFEEGAAGAAIMYSKRIAFRRNAFVHSRGFTSVGLLLQTCEDVTAEDNLIADNRRGVFIEGTARSRFAGNLVARNDTALVVYGSVRDARFEGNALVANRSPLELVGRAADAVFDGNFWSEADEPDLDGDGIRDAPYRLTSVFDHLRANLTAADLFVGSPAAAALGLAERAFPVLAPTSAVDRHPLARVPALGPVPRPARPDAGLGVAGLAMSVGLLGVSAGVLASGRRPRGRPKVAP